MCVCVSTQLLYSCVILIVDGAYRKRRVQRRSPASIPVTVLDLDVVDECPQKGTSFVSIYLLIILLQWASSSFLFS